MVALLTAFYQWVIINVRGELQSKSFTNKDTGSFHMLHPRQNFIVNTTTNY
jgi:hypothetical protein